MVWGVVHDAAVASRGFVDVECQRFIGRATGPDLVQVSLGTQQLLAAQSLPSYRQTGRTSRSSGS
jgi:hypothetical protein